MTPRNIWQYLDQTPRFRNKIPNSLQTLCEMQLLKPVHPFRQCLRTQCLQNVRNISEPPVMPTVGPLRPNHKLEIICQDTGCLPVNEGEKANPPNGYQWAVQSRQSTTRAPPSNCERVC